MKRTLRRKRARRKRSSLSLSEGAATGQTPSQPFERRLLQQDERVPHIVLVGLGTHRQHRSDGLHQPCRPSAGFALPRIFFPNAHVNSMTPGVCHTHGHRARPFRAAAPARRARQSPSPATENRKGALSLPRCCLSGRMVANNPDLSGRRDDALKARVNGHRPTRDNTSFARSRGRQIEETAPRLQRCAPSR